MVILRISILGETSYVRTYAVTMMYNFTPYTVQESEYPKTSILCHRESYGGGDIPGQTRDAILTMAYRDTLP